MNSCLEFLNNCLVELIRRVRARVARLKIIWFLECLLFCL